MDYMEGVFSNQELSRKRRGRSEAIFTPELTTPVLPVVPTPLTWVCPFAPPFGRAPPDTL